MRLISPEALWDRSNRILVLTVCGAAIIVIAVADWLTEPYVSLGLLYLFPIMLAAGFLSRLELIMLAALCAALSEGFSSLDPSWRLSRYFFQTLALSGCGLFAFELLRNRRLMLETQQQERTTQQRFHVLLETSPAAIVTVDQNGIIDLANRAAVELMEPSGANLIGKPIAAFLPELEDPLLPDPKNQLRRSVQSHVRRGKGERFPAEIRFSTFQEHGRQKLAVMIDAVAEERPVSNPVAEAPPASVAHSNGADRPTLTRRQLAILQLVCQGLRNTEIEERLQITASAVKNNLQRLFLKTGARNRSQLVRAALERYRDLL